MNSYKKYCQTALVFFAASWIATGICQAQDDGLQKLIQGKKLFWEAQFEQATVALRAVIDTPTARNEYLFEAYLYTGFVMMRENAPMSQVNANFEKAVRLNSKRQLDELVIPPDLTEQFNLIRDGLVGCIYVRTIPDEVDIVGVFGDSILFNENTPLTICELTDKTYQLLLTYEGYEEEFMPLQLTAGRTDTITVALVPKIVQKRNLGKLWTWMIRGGIVVTAGAVLYSTVISGSGNLDPLPAPPPDHPTN